MKKGRARFIGENKICLACPPIINYLEDIKMDNNSTTEIIEYARQTIEKINDEYRGAAPGEFDKEIAKSMIETMKYLMNTAVKLEAVSTLLELSKVETDSNQVLLAVVDALQNIIRDKI